VPLSSPKLRRLVKNALIAAGGDATPTLAQLAPAFDLLCDRLRSQLRPLFGGTATAALFARALHLATSEFPWLADLVSTDGEVVSRPVLERIGDSIDRDTLAEGFAAVLAHEIGLLSVFIGEDFVMPLVQAAWETTTLGAPRIEGDHE
jgi:hypothetical protein